MSPHTPAQNTLEIDRIVLPGAGAAASEATAEATAAIGRARLRYDVRVEMLSIGPGFAMAFKRTTPAVQCYKIHRTGLRLPKFGLAGTFAARRLATMDRGDAAAATRIVRGDADAAAATRIVRGDADAAAPIRMTAGGVFRSTMSNEKPVSAEQTAGVRLSLRRLDSTELGEGPFPSSARRRPFRPIPVASERRRGAAVGNE